jgi:hypothetical protein
LFDGFAASILLRVEWLGLCRLSRTQWHNFARWRVG